MSSQTHALAAPYPHLNVVLFCSLLRVRNSLEASLANIEMGVPEALLDSVGSKIPSSVAIYAKVDSRHSGSTAPFGHANHTRRESQTAPDGKAKHTRRAGQLHQTGKPDTPK